MERKEEKKEEKGVDRKERRELGQGGGYKVNRMRAQ